MGKKRNQTAASSSVGSTAARSKAPGVEKDKVNKKAAISADRLKQKAEWAKAKRACAAGLPKNTKCLRTRCGRTLESCDGDWGDFIVAYENCQVIKTPIGEVCGPCVRTWTASYDFQEDLKTCIERCNADEKIDDEFEDASLVEGKHEIASWRPAQTTVDSLYGMSIEVPMIGVKPNEFFDRYRYEASTLGYRLRDLPLVDRTHFKGYAGPDDGKWGDKGIKYKLYADHRISKQEFFMTTQDHLREDQPEEILDHLTCASKGELKEVSVSESSPSSVDDDDDDDDDFDDDDK